MRYRLRRCAAFSGALMLAAMIAVSAYAVPGGGGGTRRSETPHSETPLMVIRYNQPRVYYSRQLYNAASRALEIKPDVVFSLVSFVPQYGNGRTDDRRRQAARRHLQKLVGKMQEIGIPRQRIRTTRTFVSDAPHHEIYLYLD